MVPDVYFVKDGYHVANYLGTVDNQVNPYVSMNEKQQKVLDNIYQKNIDKLN